MVPETQSVIASARDCTGPAGAERQRRDEAGNGVQRSVYLPAGRSRPDRDRHGAGTAADASSDPIVVVAAGTATALSRPSVNIFLTRLSPGSISH